MNHQLRLPLPPEDLYPEAVGRKETEVEADNRAINELIQRFDLTEEEASEFYFTRINPRKRP